MVIEKGACYGRTTEEIKKFGFLEDNESNIKVDNKLDLSRNEVTEMFPNQFVILKAIDCNDIYKLSDSTKVEVLYFKCEPQFAGSMVEYLKNTNPKEIYFAATCYDPALEGDVLWN